MKSILLHALCVYFIVSVMSGCQRSGTLSGLVPARGTVTCNGQPLANATITLFPSEGSGNRNAVALSDSQGNFTLRTLKSNDGIAPGEYRVSVTKVRQEKSDPDAGIKALSGQEQRSVTSLELPKQIHEIPEKYASPDTSQLTVSIGTKGNSNIILQLKKSP